MPKFKKIKSITREQEKPKSLLGRAWHFLWKDDSLVSWIVSIILAFIIVKFVFFPVASLALGTGLPLVVVESHSMYHQGSFLKSLTGFAITDEDSFIKWWNENSQWYEQNDIRYSEAKTWSFDSGLDKGDIIVVKGTAASDLNIGDIIIFEANQKHPIIHRIVKIEETSSGLTFETKGDNNSGQLYVEKNIQPNQIIGEAIARIPKLGWIKLFFVEIINSFK